MKRFCFCLFSSFFCIIHIDAQWADITTTSGISHIQRSGTMFGGGAAMVDLDQDGWLDIVLTGGAGDDVIYWNNSDNTFDRDIFNLPQNAFKNFTTSAINYLDYNHDGCTDLLFSTYSRFSKNILLKNDCNRGFINVTSSAGLDYQGETMGAILLDIDHDGWEDVYYLNYIESAGFLKDSLGRVVGYNHTCAPNVLYRNNQDGTFKEVDDAGGASGCGCSLAAVSSEDINGRTHIYVANDFGSWLCPNEYFVQNENESFQDQAELVNLDKRMFGMGIAATDFNDDGFLDYYITNIGANALLVSDDRGIYNEENRGVENTFTDDSLLTTGWGTTFLDFDLDGDQDLIVANGYIPSAGFLNNQSEAPIAFYKREGADFNLVQSEFFGQFQNRFRGLAKGDIDNDGDEDVIVQAVNISADGNIDPSNRTLLLENQQVDQNDKLIISLENQDGLSNYGASIDFMEVRDSRKRIFERIISGGSHASQHSDRIHLGLGKNFANDNILKVIWPDGDSSVFSDLPLNEHILVDRSAGEYRVVGCTDSNNNLFNPLASESISCSKSKTTPNNELAVNSSFVIYPTLTEGDVQIFSDYEGQANIKAFAADGRLLKVYRLHIKSKERQNLSLPAHNGLINMLIILKDEPPQYHHLLMTNKN